MRPNYLRANLLYNQGRYLDAEAELRAALAAGDNSSQVHALLGLCFLNARLPDEALKEFGLALAKNPNDPFNHFAMSFVETTAPNSENLLGQRRVMLNPKSSRGSLQCAMRAVELAPHDTRYLTRLAEVFQMHGRWKESLEAAQSALALAPEHCPAVIYLAEALIKLNRLNEAKAALNLALEANPDTSLAHAGMGWTLLRAGERDRAEQFFNEALRMRAGSRWAQEGALECAKQKYRIHRWIVRFKNWFKMQHWSLVVVAGLALAASAFGFLFLYFSWADPALRKLLGNEGFAILTLAWVLGGSAVLFYHEQIFLWMARRQVAANTSFGVEQRRLDARMLMLMLCGMILVPVDIFLEKLSSIGPAILSAIIPGVFSIVITFKYFSPGKRRRLWLAYVLFILTSSPFAVIALKNYSGEIPKPIHMLVVALLPYLPVVIAGDAAHKRRQKQKHLDTVSAVKQAKISQP